MLAGKKILVVMPAYNAARTLERTFQDIPFDVVDEVLLVDDASHDETLEVARRLGIRCYLHERNMGYGRNQKTCYTEALKVDLVRGIAVYAGFKLVEVPGATCYLDTDYAAMGAYGLRELAHCDLLFLHIEAPDEAGHQGSQAEKVKAIEQVDEKIVGPLLKGLPSLGPFKILITSDHATPVSLKTHSRDPVPFALASGEQLRGGERRVKFGESEASKTGLEIAEGFSIVRRMIG